MIKNLIFTAALLAPSLAWGQNPSAPLSVQIVSGGSSACGSETAPTQAVAAGFTTCAADFDFSQPLYAALSNWVDCTGIGITPGIYWHFETGQNTPCNSSSIFQTTDPVSPNPTVMDFKYLPSYYNHGFNYITLDTINKTPNAQLDFGNAYYEFVYRVDTNTNWNSTGGNAQAAGWTWTTNNIYNGTGQFEIDMGEIANFGGPGAIAASNYNFGGPNPTYWACPGAAPPSGCPTYTTTAYHTYGMLLTSNGTNQAVCQWVDNNLSSCQNMTPPSGGNNYTADRHFLKMWIGVQNAASISGTVNLYIKSARVWSCANWNDGSQGSPPYTNPNAAAQCNGSNLFNSGGLTYYH